MKCSILIVLLLFLAIAAHAQSSVTLAWDPSPGTNKIVNYKVWWGVATRNYTNSISAGTNLTAIVTNLTRGSTYYFAATATDNNALTSDYSAEVFIWSPLPPAPPSTFRIVISN